MFGPVCMSLLQEDVCTPCEAQPAPQCPRMDQQQPGVIQHRTTRATCVPPDPAGGQGASQRDQLSGGSVFLVHKLVCLILF